MPYTNINKSSDYFNTKLFTANASTQSITGVGFQPDMVWGKSRGNAYDHEIYDAVRGVYKRIKPNQNHAEASDTGNLTSFDSDGFSLGSATNMNYTNGDNIVAWNWLANGQGSANSDGTITTTYTSANTTSGFSIVKYTGNGTSGATVGHGLGSAPKMIIVKELNNASTDWYVYHESIGATKFIRLNLTNATNTTAAAWNDTAPSSSVFTLGNGTDLNGSSDNYIAYCFAEKTGYSKFSSHVGNGSTDGAFIYTGFKPAWFLLKPSSGTGQWFIWDSTRSPINQAQKILSPESSVAESDSSGAAVDFVSNGIKIRNSDGGINQSGVTYITMAFAEAPLVGSNNVPCTAR